MTLEELQTLRDRVGTDYNNFASPFWIVDQLNKLKGKYDALSEQINMMEQANAATTEGRQQREVTNTNASKRKHAVQTSTEETV